MSSPLLIIFMIVFVDLVGFGIVIPILPYYAQQYGASAFDLGWLMTVYSLAQFLLSPIWGRLSDRFGRRPILLLSLVGTVVSMTLLGFASSLFWLFAGRIFAGIFTANISTAYAYVADVTSEKDRAKGMGMVGAAFGLGFIFGPVIGGILSRYGFGMPMFVAAGLAAINLVFAYFRLREPASSQATRAANRTKRFDLEMIRSAFSDRRTALAIGLFFILTLAVTQMEVVFAIYMKSLFGFDAEQAGYALAAMGFIMVMMQGGFIGPLSRKFGELNLIRIGFAICTAALLAFAQSATAGGAVGFLCLLAVGHGMLHPSLSSLASLGAPRASHGGVMGVYHSASSLARVLGPLIAGWLYDHVGGSSPFLAGALLLAFACVIAMFSNRSVPRS
jgi:DHA1 family tetracycline resistance protein-like MFS transporter